MGHNPFNLDIWICCTSFTWAEEGKRRSHRHLLSGSYYDTTGRLSPDTIGYEDWFPMNHSEALKYYTLPELSGVISSLVEGHTLPWYTADKVSRFADGQNLDVCNVARTPGSMLRYRDTSDDTKSIVDLISLMISHKSNSLFIVGDSVSLQHFDDAYCSLRRAGLSPKLWR